MSNLTHPFSPSACLPVCLVMCVLVLEGVGASRKRRVAVSRQALLLPSFDITGSQCQPSTCQLPACAKRRYYHRQTPALGHVRLLQLQ